MSTTAARRRAMRDLIARSSISSQAELVALLTGAGHPVTQATVSRDLQAIGAVKDDREEYVLGHRPSIDEAMANLSRLVDEFVEVIRVGGTIVTLRTPPGAAQVVASALDQANLDGVVGTVAGDDTIFVATLNPRAARATKVTLEEIGANA